MDKDLEVYRIKLDDILEPSLEVRHVISAEGLNELASSIKEIGLLNPIMVKKSGEKFEIVAGHRRFLATRIAGLDSIRCFVVTGSEEVCEISKLHENLFREEINPVDEGLFFRSLLARFSWGVGDLSSRCGRSHSYVYDRLTLLEMDPMIVEAVKDDVMSIGVAKELSKVDDDAYRRTLVEAAIKSGITIRVAQNWRIEYMKLKGYIKPAEPVVDGSVVQEPREIVKLPCWSCKSMHEPERMCTLLLCFECYDTINQVVNSSAHTIIPNVLGRGSDVVGGIPDIVPTEKKVEGT